MKKIGLIALSAIGSLSAVRLGWIDGNYDDDNDSFDVDHKGAVHSMM